MSQGLGGSVAAWGHCSFALFVPPHSRWSWFVLLLGLGGRCEEARFGIAVATENLGSVSGAGGLPDTNPNHRPANRPNPCLLVVIRSLCRELNRGLHPAGDVVQLMGWASLFGEQLSRLL